MEDWYTDVFTRGQFWHSGIVIACVCVPACACVCQSLACSHDNSSAVQAGITKFGPEVQNTLVKILIVLRGGWPWSSRLNLTLNSNFILPKFQFVHVISIQWFELRVSQFGPEMHLSTVKIPNNLGLDWLCPSISFLILHSILVNYRAGVTLASRPPPICNPSRIIAAGWSHWSSFFPSELIQACWIKWSPRLFHGPTVSQYVHVLQYTDLWRLTVSWPMMNS